MLALLVRTRLRWLAGEEVLVIKLYWTKMHMYSYKKALMHSIVLLLYIYFYSFPMNRYIIF